VLDGKNPKIVNFIPKAFFPAVVFSGRAGEMLLQSIQDKNIFVLISRSAQQHHGEKLKKLLEKNKLHFFELASEPTLADQEKFFAEFQHGSFDTVIGIGGGSVLDLAKLIRLESEPELILIPTTIGTGSEASQFSLLLDGDKKKIFSSPRLLPDIVILDPQYLVSLKKETIIFSAIDAIAHAVEGLASRASSPLTDSFATKAIDLIFENLVAACNEKNTAALAGLQTAGFFAGVVQSTASVGLIHALAHYSGPRTKAGHGEAISVWLVDVLRFNMANSTAYSKLDACKSVNSKNFVQELVSLFYRCGFDLESVKKPAVDTTDIRKVAEAIRSDVCTKTNPIMPRVEDVELLLRGKYG